MTEDMPTGEKVYDPVLGKERDAFPGEIVPPEQQKTLQRLMNEGGEQFQKIYDAVAATGQLTQDELDAVLKARGVYAELERRRYLEAIKRNPVDIIEEKLESITRPINSEATGRFREDRATRVNRFREALNELRATDRVAGRPQLLTSEYVSRVLSNDFNRCIIGSTDYSTVNRIDLPFLAAIGGLPAGIDSFNGLFRALVPIGGIPSASGRFVLSCTSNNNVRRIDNIPAQGPGLEGIYVDIIKEEGFGSLVFLTVKGDNSAWTRILDTPQPANTKNG